MTQVIRSRIVSTLAATAVLTAVPGLAMAHVTVNPTSATPGSYVTLTFKVPTESATASTTKVEVDLPTDHPFGSVSYQPVAGWTTAVTTTKLAHAVETDDGDITEAPTKIVWTAQAGAGIKPGQFQTFLISAGPVPDTAKVQFDVKQTYSDGSVVNWNQPTVAGQVEPDHPAPVLYVSSSAPNAANSAVNSASPSTAPSVNAAAAQPHSSTGSSGNAGVWFGVGGIAIGALALVVAAYALVRRPR